MPLAVIYGIECRHHFGITTHEIVPGEFAAETVYRIMREKWHPPRENGYGLCDDNHTWEHELAPKPGWFDRVVIFKNEKSPPFLAIPGFRSMFAIDDGPGARWFDQEFKLATPETVQAEAEEIERFRRYFAEQAELQRDTVRGRKARKEYEGGIYEQDRLLRVLKKRWPQHFEAVGA